MTTSSLRRTGRRLASAARERVGVDLRSLAAFRIALGALIVADLLLRARDLTAHYTDAGVLPREVLFRFFDSAHLSLHALSGALWWQVVLFVVAGAFGLALLVGYQTRLAAVVSWLLLVSLQNRNPIVLNGGDILFKMLLLWAMFLPLGARWSLDAVRAARRGTEASRAAAGASGWLRTDADARWWGEGRVASLATGALLLQVVIVYGSNALLKLGGDLWLAGTAIRYVFSLDQFTVLLGNHLGAYPTLLTVLAELWLVMLVASPLLVLLTGRLRGALAGAFMGAHVGMLLTMMLGLFPLIAVAALVPFLPAALWDALDPWLAGARARGRSVGRRLDAALPRVAVALPSPGAARWVSRGRLGLVAVLFVLVVLVNAQALGGLFLPGEVETAVSVTQVDQRWNMFAPNPVQVDGWYVVPGGLSNGSTVDAFHGGEVDWDRPPDLAHTYPNARWRKYLVNLWRDGYRGYREPFAAYLCERWDRTHEVRMENVTLYYMEQPTRLDAPEPIERVRLYRHRCS